MIERTVKDLSKIISIWYETYFTIYSFLHTKSNMSCNFYSNKKKLVIVYNPLSMLYVLAPVFHLISYI